MKRRVRILCASACAILLCLFLVGCQEVASEDQTVVQAVVVEKKYSAGYTTFVPMKVGKTTILRPQSHPAKHYVMISYEDITATIDNEDFYNEVKVGEEITVILYQGYDKTGKLVVRELRLKEKE